MLGNFVRSACAHTCILLLSFLAVPASSLEISYSTTNPFDGSVAENEGLVLRGEISPGDYEYILDVIRNDKRRFWEANGLILASAGGDVDEALKIARLVKGTYTPVFVGRHFGPCASACFFIYAAAARREAATHTLSIHRPYIHPRRLMGMRPLQAEAYQNEVLHNARVFLEGLHVPTNLIDAMFQRASTEIYWLSQPEIDDQLGRRPPWYEQFLIANCGLDKALEKRYFSTNDPLLIDRLLEIDSCANRLTRRDARQFLRTELDRTKKQ